MHLFHVKEILDGCLGCMMKLLLYLCYHGNQMEAKLEWLGIILFKEEKLSSHSS